MSVGAPEIHEHLCEECHDHFEELKTYLTAANVQYTLNPRLVRGLDYYTKTAFEVQYTPLGAQSAVAGGGRYDGLVEELDGRSLDIPVEMDGQGKSMKAQLKYANKINAKYVIILGDDELVRKEAIIRFMDTSEQETVSLDTVAERITSLVKG